MKDTPDDRTNCSRAYYCITIDMSTRGNFVLGAGESKNDAKKAAISNLVYIFSMGYASLIYEHAECIRNLDIYYGMLARSNTRGETYNRLNMRFCESKIFEEGEEKGYNGMSYVLSQTIANYAVYCSRHTCYHEASHLQMQFV